MIYCKDCKFRTASNLMSGVPYCAFYNTPIEAILGCESGESKIITNADRIRAMSDEELARKFAEIEGEPYRWISIQSWLEWMKQEAET